MSYPEKDEHFWLSSCGTTDLRGNTMFMGLPAWIRLANFEKNMFEKYKC